jgi:hypothetical protein
MLAAPVLGVNAGGADEERKAMGWILRSLPGRRRRRKNSDRHHLQWREPRGVCACWRSGSGISRLQLRTHRNVRNNI